MDQHEQKSLSWEAWRLLGVGASDAPVIMGVSPWKTALQLYLEKTGGRTVEVSNFAIERGMELEPVARAQFELLMGVEFPPMLAVHPTRKYMRASLDGYNEVLEEILEIKCPGKVDHETAMGGKIPEKYKYQLQHQLYVTGAKKGYYYSFDGTAGCIVEVYPDAEAIERLVQAVDEFWLEHVVPRIPPKLSASDWMAVDDEPDLAELFREYRRLKNESDGLAETLARLKQELISKLDSRGSHPKVCCDGIKLSRSEAGVYTIRV